MEQEKKREAAAPEHRRHSIAAKDANLIMAAFTLIISALLITATHRATAGYFELRATTDHYIQWQEDASDLQVGADILTEQARCFAETGKLSFLEGYFEEANVTRHRDNAVRRIHDSLGETPAYQALVSAMAESEALMEREYYSMRLKIEACGYEIRELPEVLRETELTPEDAALTPEEKDALARSMVFDDFYREKKDAISGKVRECLGALAGEIDGQQNATADQLHRLLKRQRILIYISIIMTLLMLLATLVLMVRPLVRATSYIRAEKLLPLSGSTEYRFLANTYNQIYDTNREQREQLAYDATHDKLTGVYNRNGYDLICQNTDLNTAALILIDLDKFKPVNDTYGYKMGDRVLERAARAIRNAFRPQDHVCRIGGDEFAVIMVDADTGSAESIRRQVDAVNRALSGEEDGVPPIHMSSGAAYGKLIPDFDKLFKTADAALYRIKNSGGGGCEVCL